MDNEAQGTINRRVAMHIKRRVSGWLTLAVFAVGGAMVASDPAFAKVDVDNLTIGGEARVRYEYRTSVYFGGTTGNLSYATDRIRVNVGYDLTPDVSFFAQIQDARAWGGEITGGAGGQANSGIGAVSSANQTFGANVNGIDLHQGYIQLRNVLVPGLSVKAGRQEIIFGDHRLFGNFGWSQIGNSFDAVRLTHSMPIADVDVFWARIADTGNAGLVGAQGGVALTGAAGAAVFGTRNQDIYGLYVTLKPIPSWTIEPYYFLLQDTRPAVVGNFNTVPQAADQTRSTVGGRINGKAGGLDATAELAWQFGGASSGASQVHNLHINAWAGVFKAGYTFDPVPMKPRVGIEIDYASGSNCTTTCGKDHTFDNLYPTNHGQYSYMDLMAWRNMVRYMAMFDVKPDAVSKLQVNFSIDRLANHLDNWYRANQTAYATTLATNTSSSLGRELDVHYYRTIKEKFKFEIGAGHFWAGSYTNAANLNTVNGGTAGGTNGSGQNWGYVMGSVLF